MNVILFYILIAYTAQKYRPNGPNPAMPERFLPKTAELLSYRRRS